MRRQTLNKKPDMWQLVKADLHTFMYFQMVTGTIEMLILCCSARSKSRIGVYNKLANPCVSKKTYQHLHSSNRVSGISTRTMHQSTAPSLSQIIWSRWASRQFLSLPIVQTLLPVTFGYSLSSEAVVMRQIEEMKEVVTKVIDTLTQEDFHGAFLKLLERYNKCIAAGGDYFKGD